MGRELRSFIRRGTGGIAPCPKSFAATRIGTAPGHPPKIVQHNEARPPVEHLSQDEWRDMGAMNVSKQNQIGLVLSDMPCQFRRVVTHAAGARHSPFSECNRRNVASGSAECFG